MPTLLALGNLLVLASGRQGTEHGFCFFHRKTRDPSDLERQC
jgi:hypothetical protein